MVEGLRGDEEERWNITCSFASFSVNPPTSWLVLGLKVGEVLGSRCEVLHLRCKVGGGRCKVPGARCRCTHPCTGLSSVGE